MRHYFAIGFALAAQNAPKISETSKNKFFLLGFITSIYFIKLFEMKDEKIYKQCRSLLRGCYCFGEDAQC